MRKLLLALAISANFAEARDKAQGWCEQGGVTATVTAGLLPVTPLVQGSYASCTVTVYKAGTLNLATIYADNAGTPKANPFTAAASGAWFFYGDAGRFDVKFSGGGITTRTDGDYVLQDQAQIDFDVMDTAYGALCDGTTDDHVAIQAAITAANVAGGAVRFPPGKTCSLGATGVTVPATSGAGVRLFGQANEATTLTYTGNGAAITVGAAGSFAFRTSIEYLRIVLTNAGNNAIGILWYNGIHWRLAYTSVLTSHAYANQIGVKLMGGSAADARFGAHGVWTQNDISGFFAKGLYMTSNQLGWGYTANLFQGGRINNTGNPAGSIGFHLEQGNQNVIEMVDLENWDTAVKSEAFDNVWVGLRTESTTTAALNLAAATGSTTGGTFNRVIGSWLSSTGGIVNSVSNSQIWATQTAVGLENHITNIPFIDSTTQVTDNVPIFWNVIGGSAGVFWRNTSAGATQAGLYVDANVHLFAGTAAINSDLILDGVNTGSTIRLRHAAADKVKVDGSGNVSILDHLAMIGNSAIKFINAGGGGSTGFNWYTGAASVFAGGVNDDGSRHYWEAGTAAITRDLVFDVKNAASAFKVQRATVDYLTIDSNGLNLPKGIYKNSAGFQHIRAASCATAAAAGATCDSTIAWNTVFADANYTLACTLDNPTNVGYVLSTKTRLAASSVVTIAALTAAAASGTLNCVAVHD